MTATLTVIRPPGCLFRVGRKPDPWAWPAWEFAGSDGTFGNRWDDPQGSYRVLYACSQLAGCFVEILARFRPDAAVVAGLAAIQTEGEDEPFPAGDVPKSFLQKRCIGEASIDIPYADIGTASSLAHLHVALASRLIHFGVAELDAAAIRRTAPRQLTQEISRYIYTRSDDAAEPIFGGIEYESRFGDDFHNWAIFEGVGGAPNISDPRTATIEADNAALQEALQLLRVRLR